VRLQLDFFPQTSMSSLLSAPSNLISQASIARASRIRQAARDFPGNAQARVNAQLQKLRGKVSARYRALRQPIRWTPKRTLLRDKLAFVLGVFHIITSAYWLGHAPTTFYKLYTVKALFLFAIRFYLYRREKMHYYLLDFCYFANLLLMVQLWFFPASCDLEKIMFAFAMGPLAWSIVAFRNSMIFHSLDKVRPARCLRQRQSAPSPPLTHVVHADDLGVPPLLSAACGVGVTMVPGGLESLERAAGQRMRG
jgi:hypothetical protein